MKEPQIAKESSVQPLNAVGTAKRENPFRNIKTRPISESYRRELEAEGVNMRFIEQARRDERDRRIEYEYETQLRNIKNELREKYPLGNYANTAFTTDRALLAQAKAERAAYNRELNQAVKRLNRQAEAAKRK